MEGEINTNDRQPKEANAHYVNNTNLIVSCLKREVNQY